MVTGSLKGKPRHYKAKVAYVRQQEKEKKNVDIKWKQTSDMTADILTKPLPRALFQHHTTNLMSKWSSDEGGVLR